MLHLFHSNQLECLAAVLAQFTANDPLPPFEVEQVVVQNAGMGRWLSMQLAEYNGIVANMRYIFPAEMTWELLRKVLPDVPERDPCSPRLLRWRLLAEFLEHPKAYPELAHYLRPNDESAAWQLAQQVANVLDGYLFFRPEWIKAWEQQTDPSDWQQRLWQRVVIEKQLPHSVSMQQAFFHTLQRKKPENLPKRIIFFSVPAVSEAYIQLINQVAQFVEVYFFIINPSIHYWSDIESERRKLKFDLDEQDYIEVGNPLLASWGVQGRDFIGNLRNLEPYPNELEHFVEANAANSMLDIIHTDMLQLESPQVESVEWVDVSQDNSIRLHSCHSPMREAEVLQDQLLAAIEQDATLTPSDIVVMMPDIDRYAPYIDAVFSTAPTERWLPFSIADQSQRHTQSLTTVCLQLLELPDSRFEAERIFALLENALLCQAANLSAAEVQQCREWVSATNIRWGLDATSRRRQGGADTQEHTWRYGLDRLLLGYAMPTQQLFTDILPFNHIEGSAATTLGKFMAFVDSLFVMADWSFQRASMSEWAKQCWHVLQQLFPDLTPLQFVLKALDNITKQAEQESAITRALSWRIFRDALRAELEQRQQAEGFMGRGITFCALMPMRSVPFKMVVLLGMQDNAFPRVDHRISFDRLGKENKRRGDRSRRDEDRYLFLESVLSARQRLYISYVGQNIYDNTALMPSVLVSELLDYLERRFDITAESLITKHPLQAFSPRYFTDTTGKLFTYRTEYAATLQRQHSIESQQSIAFWAGKTLPPLSDEERHVDLETLVNYYQQPAREFLRRRLNVQLRDYEKVLPEREPFALDSFVDQDIAQKAFEALDKNPHHTYDADALVNYFRAKGALPHGVPGDLISEREQQRGVTLYQQTLAQRKQGALAPQDFQLALKAFTLSGTLHQLSKEGRELFYFGKLGAWQWVEIWLSHLVWNALPAHINGVRDSYIHTPEESYQLLTINNASEQLQFCLERYWLGMQKPLPFAPRTSLALLDNRQLVPRLEDAKTAWEGSSYAIGESTKPENALLYRNQLLWEVDYEAFETLAQRFWLPMLSNRVIL